MDPFTYIGRVYRHPESGDIKIIEVFKDKDDIHIQEGDEFITFTTVIALEGEAR